MLPVVVGRALAFRMRGEPRVAVGWFARDALPPDDDIGFSNVRDVASSS
jgi:hypothetical protein